MTYLRKGIVPQSRYTFNFIITPMEFEKIFKDLHFHFVITNSRVEKNYTESDKEYIFQAYNSFFNKILTGQREQDQIREIEEKILISITDNLNKVEFEDISDSKTQKFKLVKLIEPVINIGPLYLTLTEDNKLSVAYSNKEGTIGLEVNYPKVISLLSEECRNMYETKGFSTYNLYEKLIERIKDISHKAKVSREIKIFKPNIWISDKAIEYINNNNYLKSHRLTIQ